MKIKSTILFFSLSVITFGQIPSGYYNGTEGLEGFQLKTKLYNIIRNFNSQSYDALKTLYKSNNEKNGFRDKYYEFDNSVLDIYSEKPDGGDPYNYNPNSGMGSGAGEGDAFNREHLIPQSYFDSNMPMKGDAFHVWPTDSKVNGWRGNEAFGKVNNPQSASPCNSGASNLPCKSQNGTLKGKFVENTSITVMEPIDEFKGDVARAFFYFVTCYQDKMDDFYNASNSGVKAMFDGSIDKVFKDDFLEMLMQWHVMDPPSQREQDINDLIYYNHQSNRNPYIDHPEYVSIIWGDGLDANDIDYQTRKDVSVFTTQMKDVVIRLENLDKSMDLVSVYDLSGRLILTQKNSMNQKEIRIKLPQNGVYILKVEGKRLEFNTKVLVK